MIAEAPLVEIENLKVVFHGDAGRVTHAVDGVDLTVARGAMLGVVGESGCGKRVTLLAVMGLLPRGECDVSGAIRFDGADLLRLPDRDLRDLRGDRLAMIFQEPMTSLNPIYKVGHQISEAIALHAGLSQRNAMDKAVEMLRLVSIPEPERRAHNYPHQMSGGMRQRVMIAMALSCNPKVLIADEPTTALDVTIQAQILQLMRELQQSYGMAMVLITHDMGVVAENADRVIVMYAGKKVEEADVDDLFERPGHPYTRGLLGSIPQLDQAAKADLSRVRLNEIKGMVPSLVSLPQGCTFAPRCSHASAQCKTAFPPLEQRRPGHWVACWHADLLQHGS